MRYTDLVKAVRVQVRNRLSHNVLDAILRACFAIIVTTLEQGEPVYIPQFGHFEIVTASSRVVIGNLGGQTQYQVPERKRVRFVPSPTWIDQLNEKRDSQNNR